jgi:hypothetical protein
VNRAVDGQRRTAAVARDLCLTAMRGA